MRPLFPKTTLVSVIGIAFLAACTVFALASIIHNPSLLGNEGTNPKTGLPSKPARFDLILDYVCFSLLAVFFTLFAIREFIEYLRLRRQRSATANVSRSSAARRLGYAALLMVSLGWIQSYLYPIAISRFFPSDSNSEFYVESGYGVVEIPLFPLFGERSAFRHPLQIEHYTLEPDDPWRPRHSFQFMYSADSEFPTYRILEVPYWCLALCVLLILALLPRKRSTSGHAGFLMGAARSSSGEPRKG